MWDTFTTAKSYTGPQKKLDWGEGRGLDIAGLTGNLLNKS